MQNYEDGDSNCPVAMKDDIMHANLTGGDLVLMASDYPGKRKLGGGKIEIALGGSDEGKLRNFFKELSEGGEIEYPLKKEVWGDFLAALKINMGFHGW